MSGLVGTARTEKLASNVLLVEFVAVADFEVELSRGEKFGEIRPLNGHACLLQHGHTRTNESEPHELGAAGHSRLTVVDTDNAERTDFDLNNEEGGREGGRKGGKQNKTKQTNKRNTQSDN